MALSSLTPWLHSLLAGIDVASIKNPGVEAREARDKQLQLKSRGSGPERLAESSAALQRKSQLYERLARGDVDDEDERYEVSASAGPASFVQMGIASSRGPCCHKLSRAMCCLPQSLQQQLHRVQGVFGVWGLGYNTHQQWCDGHTLVVCQLSLLLCVSQ